jgi:hypothetical protein
MNFWQTHKCIPSEGRPVKIGGKSLRHCRCELCGRDFVEDADSGEQYAVNVNVFGFDRLAQDVSDRWLSQRCPEKPAATDEADRLKVQAKR